MVLIPRMQPRNNASSRIPHCQNEQKDFRDCLQRALSAWFKAIRGDLFGILANQSCQTPGSAIEFKMLLFSRKTEKMFRDFHKRHNSPMRQARGVRFLAASGLRGSESRPPRRGRPGWGRDETHEGPRAEGGPGTEPGQSFVLECLSLN